MPARPLGCLTRNDSKGSKILYLGLIFLQDCLCYITLDQRFFSAIVWNSLTLKRGHDQSHWHWIPWICPNRGLSRVLVSGGYFMSPCQFLFHTEGFDQTTTGTLHKVWGLSYPAIAVILFLPPIVSFHRTEVGWQKVSLRLSIWNTPCYTRMAKMTIWVARNTTESRMAENRKWFKLCKSQKNCILTQMSAIYESWSPTSPNLPNAWWAHVDTAVYTLRGRPLMIWGAGGKFENELMFSSR